MSIVYDNECQTVNAVAFGLIITKVVPCGQISNNRPIPLLTEPKVWSEPNFAPVTQVHNRLIFRRMYCCETNPMMAELIK